MAEVADQIAEECLKDVKSILSKHVADGGTVCLAADANAARQRARLAAGEQASGWSKWRITVMKQSFHARPSLVFCELLL